MAKSFIIKSLYDKLSPQSVAAVFGKKTGLGNWREWELWKVERDYLFQSNKDIYYLAVKDDLCIADVALGPVLEYIDTQDQTGIYYNKKEEEKK